MKPTGREERRTSPTRLTGSDSAFWAVISAAAGLYVLFVLALLFATAAYGAPARIWQALGTREIQYSIALSLVTCTLAALLSLAVALPAGYLLARRSFAGRALVESIIDVPIVLPPMVVGLCLLVFFQTAPGRMIERAVPFTYTVFGIVLAQFTIGAAFATRAMRQSFEQLPPRAEEVALTLGCTRAQAVWRVALPSVRRGMFAAASVAWARSLGEFGPILVFAGATRLKTEVLPTTIWIELSAGNLEAAIGVSLLQVGLAVAILVALRMAGERLP